MDRPIHVVGAGIAGLVTSITAAEGGAPVILYEAADRPGGRALGGTDRRGVNFGPHVVLTDGALVRWLRSRDIDAPLRFIPAAEARRVRLLDDRGTRVPFSEVTRLAGTVLRRPAPVDATFRTWTDEVFGARRSELLCRLAGLFTFHHDPGTLSAAFVWERYRRTFLSPDRVRWFTGGWDTLADALVERAAALGVEIRTGRRVAPGELPDGPTVVATSLAAASRLVGTRLDWPGSRTALLDVVARPRDGWPSLVADVRSDLTTCCMIERETAIEPGLGGGDELFQAHLGIAPGTPTPEGVARIEDALDHAAAGWRERTLWRRGHVVADSTGAVDPPGTTWRDRPGIVQGPELFLAGDMVAAPGMLSEVSVNSAVRAAHLALDARRRRVFPAGWPEARLTPERRLAVLAAVLPGARLEHRTPGAGGHQLEPVDETGPGYRLSISGTGLSGLAPGDDTPERGATLLSAPPSRPPARLVEAVAARLAPIRRRLSHRTLAGRPRRR